MTVEKFVETIQCEEPSFKYKNMRYDMCRPDGTIWVRREDWKVGQELEFSDIDDLLDNWVIEGRPFREILPDPVWEW